MRLVCGKGELIQVEDLLEKLQINATKLAAATSLITNIFRDKRHPGQLTIIVRAFKSTNYFYEHFSLLG